MAAGCVSPPRAEFLHVACDRVQRGGDLEAICFSSSIQAEGLAGEQLICRVSLVDSRLRPLRSANTRFRNTAGQVAASKALMVHESPWTFDDVSVTIPAGELEIRAHDLPALAEFGVYRANGECLAREAAVLPVYGATHALRAPARVGPGARVAAKARRAQTPAAGESRTVSPRPSAQRKRPPSSVSGRRSVTSRAVARTTRPEPGLPADQALHLPDWWCAAMVDVQDRVAYALRGLFPFDAVFATAELDALCEGYPQPPTSRPVAEPSASVGDEGRLARPTSAPGREPSDRRPGDDEQAKWRRYVVQSGGTLSHIALRLLGDAARWQEIYELNRDELVSPDELPVGLELRIPSERAEPSGADKER
jgi:nucleoid-associated protein YgaU